MSRVRGEQEYCTCQKGRIPRVIPRTEEQWFELKSWIGVKSRPSLTAVQKECVSARTVPLTNEEGHVRGEHRRGSSAPTLQLWCLLQALRSEGSCSGCLLAIGRPYSRTGRGWCVMSHKLSGVKLKASQRKDACSDLLNRQFTFKSQKCELYRLVFVTRDSTWEEPSVTWLKLGLAFFMARTRTWTCFFSDTRTADTTRTWDLITGT